MEARVKDFFNEINEMSHSNNPAAQEECGWQECFDEKTGYSYYWNVNTNLVTWEMPSEYHEWLERSDDKQKRDKIDGNVANVAKTQTLFPSVLESELDNNIDESESKRTEITNKEREIKNSTSSALNQPNADHDSFENVRSSQDVASLDNTKKNSDNDAAELVKPTTIGFSMLANYGYDDSGDSDIESDTEAKPTSTTEQSTETCSRLFPKTDPIDVNQFEETKQTDLSDGNCQSENIDVKALKRKRRIGVQLVNSPKKPTSDDNPDNWTKTVDAISTCSENSGQASEKSNNYESLFVKGASLPPTIEAGASEVIQSDNDTGSGDSTIEKTQNTIREKLLFLVQNAT